MAIITVSRELGSLGTTVARAVAKALKYRYLDKETFSQAIEEYGVSKMKIEKYDERKPTLWDTFSTDRDKFLHFMKSVIYKFVAQGNGIVVGRGGQVLLHRLPGTLSIRFRASMGQRVERVMEKHKCDSKQAEKAIRESDIDRSAFHKFFFNVSWDDPDLYDLIVNTDSLSLQSAVRLIKNLANAPEIKSMSKQAAASLANLTLSQRVETRILYEERIPIQYLEARADHGVVVLRGAVTSQPVIELCEKTARSVEGVTDVVNEISLINYYGMM